MGNYSAVVLGCDGSGSATCSSPSASISFSLLPYTSGSGNMSCCIFDNLNGFTCKTVLVKILSDFHLLPQGDIFDGPRSKDDFSNVTIISHVRITVAQCYTVAQGQGDARERT